MTAFKTTKNSLAYLYPKTLVLLKQNYRHNTFKRFGNVDS